MKRAAIIIGVDRTGELPELNDAARGARAVEKWARGQGIESIAVLTDEDGGSVDIAQVKNAISQVVEAGTTEQLIVYFAGHGVNRGYSEYWLLSGAPRDTGAAVNVEGSGLLARFCGIPHVVFVSDACRTAPQGAVQRVTGGEIFPNDGVDGLENPVDVFYATTLGRAAHEIADPDTSAAGFRAVYTQVLLDALLGTHPSLFEWPAQDDAGVGYLRPRPLKKHLVTEVPLRLRGANLQAHIIQVPDARIASDETAWLSRLDRGGIQRTTSPVDPLRRDSMVETASTRGLHRTPAAMSADLVHSILTDDAQVFSASLDYIRSTDATELSEIAEVATLASTPFGPTHHETECGFKIRGGRFAEAFSSDAGTELLDGGTTVRMRGVKSPGRDVLLTFEGGQGVVLPALPGFLTAITIDDDELVDVAYEPSDNSERWDDFAAQAETIRALRGIASSSTRNGVFRLEGADAFQLAQSMQYAKSVDPTLAVYAAYAYQDLGLRQIIKDMSGYMSGDLGGVFFDVALLAGELTDRKPGAEDWVLSSVPMLSQGWALLSAFRVSLPSELDGIQRSLMPSAWTMFDKIGVKRLNEVMQAMQKVIV